MPKASDNAYPSLLITEGTVPASPASGKQRLYIDSTTHGYKTVNSSGTASDVGAGGGGAMTRLDEKIASGGATANFDFTSISGSYRSLVIHMTLRSQVAATEVAMACRFNNDSGANYNTARLYGTATAVSVDSFDAQTSMANLFVTPGSTGTTNVASSWEFFIARYADTVFHKQIIANGVGWSSNSSTTFNRSIQNVGRWASTAAITRITMFPSSGNLVDGSVATLYGIN
jgi:hypothetical protein